MYDEYDDDDYRNAVHRRTSRDRGFRRPVGGGVAMVPARQYGPPARRPPYMPPPYAPQPQVIYAQPERRGILEGVDKGQLVAAGLSIVGALWPVPGSPTITGTMATDLTNLAIQQENTLRYVRIGRILEAAGQVLDLAF